MGFYATPLTNSGIPSRSTHSSGVSPSTSTVWGVPLIFNVKAMDASLWLGLIGCSWPTWTAPAGCVHQWARVSRTNADDRLPLASLGRVQGGDGVVEGRDVADVRPQPSVPHPLDDLTQLGAIGLHNEVDRQAVGGPRLWRPDDGHQCSSGSNQACGPLPDVAADDIEHQIDFADVFQGVVLEVDELVRAEVERLLTVGRPPGADDVGAGLTCELRHHRPDCAGRAVREDALPRLKAAVLEQSLPRSQ